MSQPDPEKAEAAELASTPPATAKGEDGQPEVESTHSAPSMDSEQKAELEKEYPTGMKFALIMLSLYLAVFLVALVKNPPSSDFV